MPKGSFYNHFESKEYFAVAAIAKYLAGAVEVSLKTLSAEKHNPYERILRLYDTRIRFERKRCRARVRAMRIMGDEEKRNYF